MGLNLSKIYFKKEKELLGFCIRNSFDTDLYIKVLDFIERTYNAKISIADSSSELSIKVGVIIDNKIMSYFHDDLMDDSLYAEKVDANGLVEKIGHDLEKFLETI